MSQNTSYSKTVLDNGLRIVSEQLSGVHSVSIGFWICSGSRQEDPEIMGISHLVEHLLFKGTKHRSAFELAVSLESLGGHLNGFTERESICFYSTILSQHLEKAVEILSDLVQAPLFEEDSFHKEKQVVLEEISNLEDAPEDFIHDRWFSLMYPDHPLGMQILGTEETLASISLNDVHTFYRSHFTPQNIIIAASGAVDHEKLVAYVQKYVTLDGSTGKKPVIIPGDIGSQTVEEKKEIQQCHFITGLRTMGYRDERKFALILFNTWLGAGMSSYLFQEVRENAGLAYSVYSFLDFLSDTGVLGCYAGTSFESAQRTLDMITRVFDPRKNLFPAEELARLKSQLTGSLWLSLEDSFSRMNRLAKMEAYTGAYTSVEEVIQRFEAVTSDAIRNLANDIFLKNSIVTLFFMPSEIDYG